MKYVLERTEEQIDPPAEEVLIDQDYWLDILDASGQVLASIKKRKSGDVSIGEIVRDGEATDLKLYGSVDGEILYTTIWGSLNLNTTKFEKHLKIRLHHFTCSKDGKVLF